MPALIAVASKAQPELQNKQIKISSAYPILLSISSPLRGIISAFRKPDFGPSGFFYLLLNFPEISVFFPAMPWQHLFAYG